MTKVDRILYAGTLPSLQSFTLCHWTKITYMSESGSTFSYANSEGSNALLIELVKSKAMNIYLNEALLLVKCFLFVNFVFASVT